MMSIDDKISTGETVSAVLRDAATGKVKQVVEGAPKPAPRYKVEVIVTDLQTGEVHRYEDTRP